MTKIVDIYGNPLQAQTLAEPQTSKVGYVKNEFLSHPSRNLTPAKLARILESAENGNLSDQAYLYADMQEKDAHLFAEMDKRKNAILSVSWSIEPPKNATEIEVKATEFLNNVVSDLDFFDDLLLSLMSAVGYGYSANEIEWEFRSQYWLPKAIHSRPHEWFMVGDTNKNELRLRSYSITGEELQPFGWIVHQAKARSGYIGRMGLCRVLAWPYLFKNYGINTLAELLEIYGIPLRIGKYPPGTGQNEKNTLLRAVVELGRSAAGIIPQDMEIEFKEASKATHNGHMAMVEWAEKSMSKAILGSTLTTQADGKSSTNALGNVHNDVRTDILKSDARQISATVTRDLFYPILALNFAHGSQIRTPRLVFDFVESEDFLQTVNGLKELATLVNIPASFVYDKLRIPRPDANDELLINQSNQSQTGANVLQNVPLKAAALNASTAKIAVDAGQNALDLSIDGLAENALDPLLRPVLKAIKAGNSYDDISDLLLQAYPEIDDSELESILKRAFFVAELWGELSK